MLMNVRHHRRPLSLSLGFGLGLGHQFPCGIASRTLCCRVQGLEESYERCSLRRAQVVPVGWHIAAALNHLPNELVLRQPHRNAVQSRPPLSATVAKRVAVAALLDLKHQRALALKRGRAMSVTIGYGISAPGVH